VAGPGWTETTTLYLTDGQGTVVGQADRTGAVTYEGAYRPYGVQLVGVPEAGPGYTGQVNDPEVGLLYYEQRYYDATSGRFQSVDPVGPSPGDLFGFNRYAYANNNPIMNIDPDGRQSTSDEVPMVAVRDSDGQIMMVPAGYAAQAIDAVQTGSNISDYTNPSFDNREASEALVKAQVVSDGGALATVEYPPVSAGIATFGEFEGFAAVALDPGNKEAWLSVASFGLFKAAKLGVRTSHEAVERVEVMEKSYSANEVLNSTWQYIQHLQKSRYKPRQPPPPSKKRQDPSSRQSDN
jgi:RHS repeat-associated protein